ncbi:hypothetical protein B0H63DRAFT_558061 [Podospora didyma]|uniref:Heterokaryon incompatibility domain-containing protein n=1 Tax=Podospora didyma TaxID=330526 RepID=A0AAE0P0R5_9PEZI|nr:hypothetical protein B0H63DRAFT_558061 [Podospora didyma]
MNQLSDIPHDDMPLCQACFRISLDALRRDGGYSLFANARDLIQSAAETEAKLEDTLPTEPLVLHGIKDKNSDASPPPLISIDVHVGLDENLDIANLNVFALPNSAASRGGGVAGRPLLEDAGSEDAFALLQQWLDNCLANHTWCHHTISGMVPQLPNRVIDVGPPDGSADACMLIPPREASNSVIRAHYIALSYCWGGQGFSDHAALEHPGPSAMHLIPICPKDIPGRHHHHDAPDDWRRESAKMGAIYRDARLTIAATGASDAFQGCFIPRRAQHKPVALPYSIQEGRLIPGEVFLVDLYPDQELCSLDLAPLSERAWITQEWMLSRRAGEDGEVVADSDEQRLFVGLGQYCSHLKAATYPEESELLGFYADWCDTVSTYSWRKLTYASDKPVAISGRVREIQAIAGIQYSAGIFYREDHYFATELPTQESSRFGTKLFTSELLSITSQLYWYAKDGLDRPEILQLPHLPTRSWISTMGAVLFHPPSRTALPAALGCRVVVPHEGSNNLPVFLQLLAPVVPCSDVAFHTDNSNHIWGHHYISRSTLFTGTWVMPKKVSYFGGGADASSPLGWACFDEAGELSATTTTGLFATALAKNLLENYVFDGFNVLFLRKKERKD